MGYLWKAVGGTCYGLNGGVPASSHVEILIPKMTVLGGGTFSICLGHECGALKNGISISGGKE